MNKKRKTGGTSAERSDVFEYDISDSETVVEAVLNAVSTFTDIPSSPPEASVSADGGRETLPPLHEVIEPDALTDLSASSRATANVRVTFHYVGCEVTVTDTNTVRVSE
ncbi:HalOD1 output domain-containing protein [Halorussus halophilus]|uniref:HalOD1 output domain-containing protein n=1 Tax=Halorussus halophilus TaxID=2650975 RepID=UPI001300EDE6|nr:HalOD1 output domain-containing protein [Halorussus halophilus]